MRKISENLTLVRDAITKQALAVKRSPDEITLLAVSKRKPSADIREAFLAGQKDFGENYLQEALEKQAELKDLALTWHFIGPIQSNKTKAITEHFAWVHTVERIKIAERLNAQRPSSLQPLNVCIQVNIDRQDSKSGCQPEEVEALARRVTELSNLKLRGLMCIPSPDSPEPAFNDLAALRETLNQKLQLQLDTLSMGMSGDIEAAISAGSTMVRIGTAIFGARN